MTTECSFAIRRTRILIENEQFEHDVLSFIEKKNIVKHHHVEDSSWGKLSNFESRRSGSKKWGNSSKIPKNFWTGVTTILTFFWLGIAKIFYTRIITWRHERQSPVTVHCIGQRLSSKRQNIFLRKHAGFQFKSKSHSASSISKL